MENMNNIIYFVKDHFSLIKNEIDEKTEKTQSEIEIYLKFLKKIKNMGLNFQENLFNTAVRFQEKMKNKIEDDKLSQFYQLSINIILKLSEEIRNKFVKIQDLIKNVSTHQKDFLFNSEALSELFKERILSLQFKIDDHKASYYNYIKSFKKDSRNLINSRTNLPSSKISQEMYFLEEKSLKLHSMLRNGIFDDLKNLSKKINYVSDLEEKLKNKIKNNTIQFDQIFYPEDDAFQQKIQQLDETLPPYHNEFKQLEKDLSLNFCDDQELSIENLKFLDFSNFLRLKLIFNQKYIQFLYYKIIEKNDKVPPKLKIYIEIILRKIYNSDIILNKEHLNQIHLILDNDNYCSYFIYNVILKKSDFRFEKPFNNVTLKKTQMKNLLQISQYFFLLLANKSNFEFELIYHYLKFSLTIFNKKGDCLCDMLNKTFILHDVNFWLKFFDYLKNYVKINKVSTIFNYGNVMNELNKKNLLLGLKNFMNVFKNNNNDLMKVCENKAFEEISLFLFKCKLDFETISDVLLYLAHKAQINFEEVRIILQKNEDLFQAQITDTRTFYYDYKKTLRKRDCFNKEKKIFVFLKHSAGYFEGTKEIFNVLAANSKLWLIRKKIFNYILFRVPLKNKRLRIILMKFSIDENLKKTQLINNFAKESKSIRNIIGLDVKRTFSDKKDFNRKGLENILRNISCKEMGNFSYYQGLNYLTSYFYLIFDNNELDTYNIVISLLNQNFVQYVDKDLEGLKKLFFFLKRLMKLFLPEVSNFLENEIKLDINIVFATWVLTLFTTTIQFFDSSYLLDEIIDIFIGKGWAGFFQVVLVIFDEIKDKIEGLKFEEILVVLTDLPKSNFVLITQNNSSKSESDRFSFKKKILKFKNIDNAQLAYFGGELSLIMEKLEQFWFQLNKKVKKYNHIK